MIYFHWLMTLLQYQYLGKFMSVLHHHLSIMHSFVTLKRKKLITFRRKLNPFWAKNKSMKYPVYTLRLVHVYIQPKNHAVLYMIWYVIYLRVIWLIEYTLLKEHKWLIAMLLLIWVRDTDTCISIILHTLSISYICS